MLDKLLLGLLLYKDLTIYEMKKALEEGINQFFPTSFGALHPALTRLEKAKRVSSQRCVEGGRSKKIFSLTASGREYFISWLEQDISIRKIQDEGLMRVFFFKEISKKQRLILLDRYLNTLCERRDLLSRIKSHHQKTTIPKKHKEAFNYRITTIDFGIGYYEFAIGWYGRLRDKIKTGEMRR